MASEKALNLHTVTVHSRRHSWMIAQTGEIERHCERKQVQALHSSLIEKTNNVIFRNFTAIIESSSGSGTSI
jgi:hypothetical protein